MLGRLDEVAATAGALLGTLGDRAWRVERARAPMLDYPAKGRIYTRFHVSIFALADLVQEVFLEETFHRAHVAV